MLHIRDLNELASEVTRREGGKESQSIAQIKETIRILCDIYAELGFCKFLGLVFKMRKSAKKRRRPKYIPLP